MSAPRESFAGEITVPHRHLAYGPYVLYGRVVNDKTLPLMEVRDALGQRVDAAHYADEATVITKNGQPRAVLISFEMYRELAGAVAGCTQSVPETITEGFRRR